MAARTGDRFDSLRDLAYESASIPVRALKLLVRHFAQLVTVICLGLAGRQAVIWLAAWVSNFSSFAASLIMPLAPLCIMVSLIYCLWLLRPSLPFLYATFPDRKETSSRVRLLSAGGMLISFLTVYATHGMLKEDLAAFRRATTIDEWINQGFQADFSRAFIDNTASLIALVVVTVILRKIIGYFALAEKGLGFTYFAAYLEVLWMSTVSVIVTNQLSNVESWALSRKSISPAYHRYVEVKTNLEESAGATVTVWDWLAEKLPILNQFVTVPIAWLTLGAVVFGTSIAAKKASEATSEPETEEEVGQQPTQSSGSTSIRYRMRSTARQEAKTAVDNALQPVAGPIKTTWEGLKTLMRAGLVPMTIFCLVFMFATAIELGVVELGRMIVGPHDMLFNEVTASYILIVARAVYLVVVVCLIASALDFFLRHTYSPAEEEAVAESGGQAPADERAEQVDQLSAESFKSPST